MATTRSPRTPTKKKPRHQTIGEAVREHLSHLTDASKLESKLADLVGAFPLFALGNEDLPAHKRCLSEFSLLTEKLMSRRVWFTLNADERAQVHDLLRRAQALIDKERRAIEDSQTSTQPLESFRDDGRPAWKRRVASFVRDYVGDQHGVEDPSSVKAPTDYRVARFLATLEAYAHEEHGRLNTGLLLSVQDLYRVDDEDAQVRAVGRWKSVLTELNRYFARRRASLR